MTDARAALVERVACMMYEQFNTEKGNLVFLFSSLWEAHRRPWLNLAEKYVAAMERTRAQCAEHVFNKQRDWSSYDDLMAATALADEIRTLPLPDATGEG